MSKAHVSVAVAAAAAILLPGTAHAAAPRIQVAGLGDAVVGQDATYSGAVSGRPYSGAFTGRIDSYDGSLPSTPGLCEPATATLEVVDERGRSYSLWSAGKVCATLLPLGVMQRFDGRYFVQSASQRGLVGTEGVLDVRLLGEQADVYAVSA